jgi:hypothetical protein
LGISLVYFAHAGSKVDDAVLEPTLVEQFERHADAVVIARP